MANARRLLVDTLVNALLVTLVPDARSIKDNVSTTHVRTMVCAQRTELVALIVCVCSASLELDAKFESIHATQTRVPMEVILIDLFII